jgi:RHS repeat-associated protein
MTIKFQEGTSSDLQYAGYYSHSASGLSMPLFRLYSSKLGRWINRDPIGEAVNINLFAYVGNSPVGGFDPSGLKDTFIDDQATPDFMSRISQLLQDLHSCPATKQTFDLIKDGKRDLIIFQAKGPVMYDDTGLNSKGDITIDFNPYVTGKLTDPDIFFPPDIALGHELVHAGQFQTNNTDTNLNPLTKTPICEIPCYRLENALRIFFKVPGNPRKKSADQPIKWFGAQ